MELRDCCLHLLQALRNRPSGFEANLLDAMLARCGCFPDDWAEMERAGLVAVRDHGRWGARCEITPAGRKAYRLTKGGR